jgi:hypothetical protein
LLFEDHHSLEIELGSMRESGIPLLGQKGIAMSNADSIKRAVELGMKVGYVFVATVDAEGLPHLAAADELGIESENRVAVSAWFCPGTLNNLRSNRRIALVIWDEASDIGHQLIGEVETMEETAVLNGFAPEIETSKNAIPQTRFQLTTRIDTVFAFSQAPHNDLQE